MYSIEYKPAWTLPYWVIYTAADGEEFIECESLTERDARDYISEQGADGNGIKIKESNREYTI